MATNMNELEQWLTRYGEAWENRDADKVGDLFAANAVYYETPYAEPFRGRKGVRDYWSSVTADQRDVSFRSEVVGIAGDTGVARWNAKFKLASSGASVELDGVFLLEFDGSGLCTSLREWWHAR